MLQQKRLLCAKLNDDKLIVGAKYEAMSYAVKMKFKSIPASPTRSVYELATFDCSRNALMVNAK